MYSTNILCKKFNVDNYSNLTINLLKPSLTNKGSSPQILALLWLCYSGGSNRMKNKMKTPNNMNLFSSFESEDDKCIAYCDECITFDTL